MTRMVFKRGIAAAIMLGGMLAAPALQAKEYVDYNYGKGVWLISTIEVDPNHVDDYLTGLRQSQVPGFEIMKKRGLIDEYDFAIRNGYTRDTANVMIMTHFVSAAGLMPDAARDQAIEKEIVATFSEDASKQAVAGYEKYRKFIDTGTWLDVKFAK